MRINYYIGNIEVERPLNYEELGIELNYDLDDNSSQAISITEFEWGIGSQVDSNDAATLINLHRTNGLAFEGLPFRIELTNDGNSQDLFNGYLDVSKALYDCDKIVISAVEKGGIDWINEVFDSKSFAYMSEVENIINPVDYTFVPYVLSSIPNNKEAFLALISTVFLLDTLVGEVKQLSQMTAGFTSWSLAVDELVKAILQITYIIGLVIILVKTIKQMIDLIIQPVKYLACMSELQLCQKGCQSFGFTFSSSILESEPYNESYIIPEKYNHDIVINSNDVEIYGFTTSGNPDAEGYYKGTFGDLLRKLKNKYNAKIIIDGSILRFEREDYNNSSYNYVIPPVDQTSFSLNTDELASNYLVNFATDINDKHTIQNYQGVETQIITQPQAVINSDMVLTSGLVSRDIGLARGTRKQALTYAEKIIKAFLTLFDVTVGFYITVVNVLILAINTASAILDTIETVLNFIGIPINLPSFEVTFINYTSFGSTIKNRIGMLLMENDIIDVPKDIVLDVVSNPRNTKVSFFDIALNNSEFLYNQFHVTRSFIPSTQFPNANQYLRYSVEGVPFCIDDYNLLKNNNYLQDSDNRNGELISCRWDIEKQTATIEYKINELYTTNLQENIITPNGK